jgi:poly(A) polymerase
MTPRELAETICRTLRGAGQQAYLVGGCVRDLVLGREPTDYDVATDARPQRVQELFPGGLSVGARFGVILVVEGEAQVEVATFRSDIGSADGRHPDRVEYSRTPEEDVRRRDFTINGLMLDPESGAVLDFVGGREDIRAGLIRAIGEPAVRFREDRLRMARAVRFAARFDYAIEPVTLAAIQAGATQIHQVSPERLREELTKLLTEGAARRGFELLEQTRLLPELLPEVARLPGVPQPPQYHPEGDVWIHTRMMLEKIPAGAPPALAWSVLLHDVGKPPTFTPAEQTGDRIRFDGTRNRARMAAEICKRLRFHR